MISDQKKAELKSFGKPDEVRTFPKGKVELIKIGGAMIGRATFEPGWKWSTSVKPLAKTKSCEAPHFQYQLSGTIHIVMDDGTEFDSRAGDVYASAGGSRCLGGRQRTGRGCRFPGDARLRQVEMRNVRAIGPG